MLRLYHYSFIAERWRIMLGYTGASLNKLLYIQMATPSSKYKAEVLRLTEMLENTFKQVQHYKKKDHEAQLFRDRVLKEVAKLQQQNQLLKLQHEAQGSGDENRKNDCLVLMNKTKNYSDKVNQIIKQLAEEFKAKVRNSDHHSQSYMNIVNLERSFAKASMGVIKYQQEFLKNAASKQLMRVELDKLKQENTHLYEMTAHLQENFAEADKICKRLATEIKKYRQQNAYLESEVQKLQQQNKSLRESSAQRTPRGGSRKVIHLEHPQLTELQSANSRLEQQIQALSNENHGLKLQIEELKQAQNSLQQPQSKITTKQRSVSGQIYSFRNTRPPVQPASDESGSAGEDEAYERVELLQQELQQKQMKIQQLEFSLKTLNSRQAPKLENGNSQSEETIQKLQSKIQSLQGEIDLLRQQIQTSEAEKDKIITVYQNQSHESNDKLLRHQDALLELEKMIKGLRSKNQELGKSNRTLTKDLLEKQEELESKSKQLQIKQKQLEKQHKQRQRERLINQVNSQNFDDLAEKDKQIEDLQQRNCLLVNNVRQLEAELQTKQKKTEQLLKTYTVKICNLEEQLSSCSTQVENMRLDIAQKSQLVQSLESQLLSINKELNQLASSYGISDNSKLIEAIADKLKKQHLLVMELTVKGERVINEGKREEINAGLERDALRKELEETRSLNMRAIDQINKLFLGKNWKASKSKSSSQTSIKSKESMQESSVHEQGLEQTWARTLGAIKEHRRVEQEERLKMKQLEAAWQEKEHKIEALLISAKQEMLRQRQQNCALREQVEEKNIEAQQNRQRMVQLQENVEQLIAKVREMEQAQANNQMELLRRPFDDPIQATQSPSKRHQNDTEQRQYIMDESLVMEYQNQGAGHADRVAEVADTSRIPSIKHVTFAGGDECSAEQPQANPMNIPRAYNMIKKYEPEVVTIAYTSSETEVATSPDKGAKVHNTAEEGNPIAVSNECIEQEEEKEQSSREDQSRIMIFSTTIQRFEHDAFDQRFEPDVFEQQRAAEAKEQATIAELRPEQLVQQVLLLTSQLQLMQQKHAYELTEARSQNQTYKKHIEELQKELSEIRVQISMRQSTISKFQRELQQAKEHVTHLQMRQEVSYYYNEGDTLRGTTSMPANFSIVLPVETDQVSNRRHHEHTGDKEISVSLGVVQMPPMLRISNMTSHDMDQESFAESEVYGSRFSEAEYRPGMFNKIPTHRSANDQNEIKQENMQSSSSRIIDEQSPTRRPPPPRQLNQPMPNMDDMLHLSEIEPLSNSKQAARRVIELEAELELQKRLQDSTNREMQLLGLKIASLQAEDKQARLREWVQRGLGQIRAMAGQITDELKSYGEFTQQIFQQLAQQSAGKSCSALIQCEVAQQPAQYSDGSQSEQSVSVPKLQLKQQSTNTVSLPSQTIQTQTSFSNQDDVHEESQAHLTSGPPLKPCLQDHQSQHTDPIEQQSLINQLMTITVQPATRQQMYVQTETDERDEQQAQTDCHMEEVEQLRARASELNLRLESLEQEARELMEAKQQAIVKAEQLMYRVQELGAENQQLSSKFTSKEQQKQDLEEQIIQYSQKLASAEQQLSAKMESIKKMEKKFQEIFQANQTDFYRLQQQISSEEMRCIQLSSEISVLCSQNETLKSSLQQARMHFETIASQFAQHLSGFESGLLNNLKAVEHRLIQTQSQMDTLNTLVCSRLETQCNKIYRLINQLETEISEKVGRDEGHLRTIAQLREQLQLQQEGYGRLEAEVERAGAEVATARDEIEQLQEEAETNRSRAEQLKQEKIGLDAQLNAKQQLIQELRTRMQSLDNKILHQEQGHLTINELQSTNAQLVKQIAELNSRIEGLASELSQATEANEAAAQLRDQNKELHQQVQTLLAKISGHESKLHEQHQQILYANQQAEASRDQIKTMQIEIDSLKQQQLSLQQQLSILKQQQICLQQQLNIHRVQMQKLRGRNCILQQQQEEYVREIEGLGNRCTYLSRELQELEAMASDRQEQERRIEEAEAKQKVYQQDISKLKSMSEKLQIENSSLKNKLESLEIESNTAAKLSICREVDMVSLPFEAPAPDKSDLPVDPQTRIKVASVAWERVDEQSLAAQPQDCQEEQKVQEADELAKYLNSEDQPRDGLKDQNQYSRQSIESAKLDLPLQLKPSNGPASYRASIKEQALSNELRITEEYKRILEAENNSLKKELLQREKQCAKYQQMEKQASSYKRHIDKLTAEIALKERLISKYDKECKAKVEDNVRLRRSVESLTEELELQRKRNKNFEDLYDRYKLKKNPVLPPSVPN